MWSTGRVLSSFYVCVYTHSILGTRLAQRATSQIKGVLACRAAGLWKQEKADTYSSFGEDTLRLKCQSLLFLCLAAFFDELSTDLHGLVFIPFFAFHKGLNPALCTSLLLYLSVSLSPQNFPTICHRSSSCLATGSCLSQQVATMTVARREPGNKDIRCYFPLLVCGHFRRLPTAAVCVWVCVCTVCVSSLLL